MAQFCEECPNRGTCELPIESIGVQSFTTGSITVDRRSVEFTFERGMPIGPTTATAKYNDAAGGVSRTVTLKGDSLDEARQEVVSYINRVAKCAQPTKVKRYLGLVVRTTCTAERD